MSPARVQVKLHTTEVASAMRKAAGAGLQQAGEYVLTEGNASVPVQEGTLLRSGSVAVDTAGLRAGIGYDTPYAVRQHEDMTLRHEGGGSAKWLENALTSGRATVAKILATAMRSRLGG